MYDIYRRIASRFWDNIRSERRWSIPSLIHFSRGADQVWAQAQILIMSSPDIFNRRTAQFCSTRDESRVYSGLEKKSRMDALKSINLSSPSLSWTLLSVEINVAISKLQSYYVICLLSLKNNHPKIKIKIKNITQVSQIYTFVTILRVKTVRKIRETLEKYITTKAADFFGGLIPTEQHYKSRIKLI